ncbi:WD domain, G-beta repeat protein (macronuclear) [Tetrahymena thermophila SB210]|uniref:WD domain, G-beta repeat protein n=1 Tax=Tetrahymena thermophila (strain SB210) TaxID=312017 RepID=Q22RF1_TETTS|nr:WD domain, G-beta repeat protein [Tetrahymena thermophila SB210]EAR88171.2 WD domain, G-beta repeat protein [Tetrahymena thermophila SB210]|eukprot:XP_001008416.2 WD domain, G-beta repeat protein [Tetrahymena thermophila SB210]
MESIVQSFKTSKKACFVENKNICEGEILEDEEYVLKFDLTEDKNYIFCALSNFEIGYFTLAQDGYVKFGGMMGENKHTKRINDIFINENVLYTCSNDKQCRLYDLKANKLIKAFNLNHEIYSISKSKHILAGANESGIVFWDLRTMKQRNQFNETHNEEVTCVKFNENIPTQFVSSSLDGILCLFDLSQQNEEEACQSIIRTDQPVDRCGYINNEIVYGITTVDSVFIMNSQTETIMQNINAIEYNEFNKDYLIDAYNDTNINEFKILVGKQKGYVEERIIRKVDDQIQQQVCRVIKTEHTKQIRQIKKIDDNVYITVGEEGSLQVITKTDEDLLNQMKIDILNNGQEFNSKMDEEAHQMFMDDENNESNDQSKKKGRANMKNNFRPF